MDLSRADFIPVGCLVVTRQESGLSLERWSIEEIRDWKVFVLEASPESLNAKTLPYDIQASLLNTTKLKRFSSLFLALWIKLEFCVQHKSPEFGTVRVYFLPDDVLRSVVDRSSSYLQKVRLTIFDEISYSNEVWNGESHLQHISRLPLFVGEEQRAGTDTDVSLLQLFNEIPSPSPAAESINDPYSKEVMYNLLQSNVAGLKTKLYPYQRRSAALMLQKEVQPGNVLDPRLLQVLDQHGASWFLDPVTGTILREPRYYDGVSGGILAEQMGSGKTLMCLALILATKTLPTQPPEHYRSGDVPIRRALAPLAEMAASCATRNAVPWKPYFDLCKVQSGEEYSQCIEALERNPGYYLLPLAEPRRVGRRPTTLCAEPPKRKIYLSNGSIVVVPNNLVAQWKQEISKHTDGLELFVVTRDDHLPRAKDLIKFDLIIFPQTRFEAMVKQEGGLSQTPLCHIHFKRCIVDEGHKLGNSKLSSKSNLLIGLDSLHVSSRWIMTGTPSQGLYGVDDSRASDGVSKNIENHPSTANPDSMAKSSSLVMERKDLERIGSIAALYLKARPWANTTRDAGDTLADWTVYLLLPKHKSTSRGRWESLESTLKSLIIRHQLSEISTLLPPVDEKVVVLEGSYQDQLSLNIFSMMIIFNAVQSQRTDLDYFFHTKQRKFLLELVYNLKQASFFGGSFFDKEDISKAVQTAEEFLQEQKVPISLQDKQLLVQAIDVGHRAAQDKLRSLSNQFHEMPVSVEGFPTEFGQAWSLNDVAGVGTLSSASMLLALQRLIHKASGKPEELNSLLNGHLIHEGMKQRESMLSDLTDDVAPSHNPSETLAGNTKFGSDNHRNLRTQSVNGLKAGEATTVDGSLGPLESVKVTATVSSKLSYLVDSIIKYQEDEKILIFYENDNVAWYLGSMLEALQIQHLIYAKGITTERRAQYVNTFHHNPKFRVLLMDITQAAFGLDMREASRIYFINPVLNPQVEAQAIGRVRRISQQKPVSVETLVLKNSVDEVILERKKHMTQAEHRNVKSILDVRPIYDWIKNASIIPLADGEVDLTSQMTRLSVPQYVFGRGFGRTTHPDDGLVLDGMTEAKDGVADDWPGRGSGPRPGNELKREHGIGPGASDEGQSGNIECINIDKRNLATRPARRVRFSAGSDEE